MKQLEGMFSFLNGPSFTSLEKTINDVFKSVPKLPKGLVDFFVNIAPYAAIIVGILNIIGAVQLMFAPKIYMQFARYAGMPIMYMNTITIVQSIVGGLILLAAFQSLKDKKIFGWRLLFWSNALAVIASLLIMNFIMAILIAAIGWYVLSQMRPSYK